MQGISNPFDLQLYNLGLHVPLKLPNISTHRLTECSKHPPANVVTGLMDFIFSSGFRFAAELNGRQRQPHLQSFHT